MQRRLQNLKGLQSNEEVTRLVIAGALACVLLLTCFALLAYSVVSHQSYGFDRQFESMIRSLSHPMATDALRPLTELGSTVVTGALCLLMAGWQIVRKRYCTAIVILMVWSGAQLIVAVLKSLWERPRPDSFQPLVDASGYSFPSGHTFTALVAYGLLAILLGSHFERQLRIAPWIGLAIVVTFVGFSRIYLGAHYATDVLGSMLAGAAWLLVALMALNLVSNRYRAESVAMRQSDTR